MKEFLWVASTNLLGQNFEDGYEFKVVQKTKGTKRPYRFKNFGDEGVLHEEIARIGTLTPQDVIAVLKKYSNHNPLFVRYGNRLGWIEKSGYC